MFNYCLFEVQKQYQIIICYQAQYCVQLKQPEPMAEEGKEQRYGQNFMVYIHSIDIPNQSYQSIHYTYDVNHLSYEHHQMRTMAQEQLNQFINQESFEIYKSQSLGDLAHSRSEQTIEEYRRRKKNFKQALEKARKRLTQKYNNIGYDKASERTQMMTQFDNISRIAIQQQHLQLITNSPSSSLFANMKNKQNQLQSYENIYTIFNETLYLDNLNLNGKKLFKRECLKTKSNQTKTITGYKWMLKLKHKSIGSKLQLHTQLINLDQKLRTLYLVSPRFTQTLIHEGQDEYLFEFAKKMQPIIFRVDNQPVLTPICMISMAKPLYCQSETQQNSELLLGNQSNLSQSISIDLSETQHIMEDTFSSRQNHNSIIQVIKLLCLEQYRNNEDCYYEGKYDFFGESITIVLKPTLKNTNFQGPKQKQKCIVRKSIFQNTLKPTITNIQILIQIFFKLNKNVLFVAQLMKELKNCVQLSCEV